MKTTLKRAILTGFILSAMVTFSHAATDSEHHHPGAEAEVATATPPCMMMENMDMMQSKKMMATKPCVVDGSPCSKPCMAANIPPARHHMMGDGQPGMMDMDHGMMGMNPNMMHKRMDHELFLDRVDALGLNPDQVAKLKEIRSVCRKENIHKAADVKVARLELKDLLSEDGWTLKTAEPLVRQIQTLEGDMLVRHLQAVSEARNVLTAEQLQKAASASDGDLEELFK